MNASSLHTQLNTIELILKRLHLHVEREWFPQYQLAHARKFRGLNYADFWLECYANRYFDFVLSDYSILQFRPGDEFNSKFSFAYLECPFDVLTYSEFVENTIGTEVENVGDVFREEYEIEILSSPLKSAVTPVRYDYDPNSYTEGLHPASHIHFGHQNNIRIGTKRILKPLSFLLLVMRQFYRNEWVLMCGMREMTYWGRNIRDALNDVDSSFTRPLDGWEMLLD